MILDLIPKPYRAAAKLGACLVAAFALLGIGAYLGSRNEAARHADTKAAHAKTLGEIADAARDVAERTTELALRVRESEAASAATISAIESRYLQEIKNADLERAALLSDLRAGRAALRLPVRACPPVLPAAGTPSTAGTGSDRAGDRDAGDGRVVALADIEPAVAEQRAIVARADARHAACQATLIEYQRLTAEAAQAHEAQR